MKVTPLALPDVLLLEPQVHGDARGFFVESYNRRTFARATGLDVDFVQDNHSRSARHVLRGLHYQLPPAAQGKLVRVLHGEIYDVAVDLRRSSPTFGRWIGQRLDAAGFQQLWIPPGFAHGFIALSDHADIAYKTTAHYHPELERVLAWNDPHLAIAWPLHGHPPITSPRDAAGQAWADCPTFP